MKWCVEEELQRIEVASSIVKVHAVWLFTPSKDPRMSGGNATTRRHEDAGFYSVPKHYAGERETIDKIRDELGDTGFEAFCLGNVIKYRDRTGLKDDEQLDISKGDWYALMARHVAGKGPDPRAARPGFVPYQRDPNSGVYVEQSVAVQGDANGDANDDAALAGCRGAGFWSEPSWGY